MARYFFNVHDGKDVIDRDGTELRDEAEARSEAVRLAGQCILDLGEAFWTSGEEWRLEVSDEERRTLFSLTFTAD
jgi:hypothetical protein